jgi:hypothetical protein
MLRTRYLLPLLTLLLAACSDEATLIDDEVQPLTLHLRCHADVTPDSLTETRSSSAHNPFFANVIYTLFAIQFDTEGIRRNYTELTTVSGSQTETTYTITLPYATGSGTCSLYVLCNFSQSEYEAVIRGAKSLKTFQSLTFSIDKFSEAKATLTDYLPAVGTYSGTLTQGEKTIDVTLGRYQSRLTADVVTADGSITYSNVQVGLHNAPAVQYYAPANSSDEFASRVKGTTQTFLSDADMLDATPFSVTSTATTSAATRYFYLGENLNTDPELQTTIRVVGHNNVTNKDFDVTVPISSTGMVDRNSNYELILQLK